MKRDAAKASGEDEAVASEDEAMASAEAGAAGSRPAKRACGAMQGATGTCDMLHEAFDHVAGLFSDRPAVEDELGGAWSYAQLRDASLRMASGLAEHLRNGRGPAAGPGPPPALALLMRRSCAWAAGILAGSRLGLPVLALSADLGSKEEVERNREALAEHHCAILILDGALHSSPAAGPALEAAAATPSLLILHTEALLDADAPMSPVASLGPRCADDALYLVYTGGTTSASKCVAVTHRMAVFEIGTYPQIAPLECTDRVLHQTSAFWGATALGFFDVVWCCGACLVLVEGRAGPAEVKRAVEGHALTVVGVVPSVLDALEECSCQSLRIVFTWGETLKASTVRRWATRVALFDLLIASEYWLILFADHRQRPGGSQGPVGFQPVPGARLTLRPPEDDGGKGSSPPSSNGLTCSSIAQVSDGEVGELFMAGPMVSSIGYTEPLRNQAAFVDLPVGPSGQLVRHFRTRDLATKREDGSLEYCGRADGFAKVGGKWLDLASVERRLREAGCKEAALVWDERMKQRHAAVVLLEGVACSSQGPLATRASRLLSLLPPDTQLHVLQALPLNPATGKVHRSVLIKKLAAVVPPSPAVSPGSIPCSVALVRQSLLCGLILAARAGARGAALLPLAWQLAPGLLAPSVMKEGREGGAAAAACNGGGRRRGGNFASMLPEGLRESVQGWACWYRAAGRCMPPHRLAVLPHVALLLLDAQMTGLEDFVRLVKAPLGALGAALLVCRGASTWMLSILEAAAVAHAERARGADCWTRAFWVGLPALLDQWMQDMWPSYEGVPRPRVAQQCMEVLQPILVPTPSDASESKEDGPPSGLGEIRSCSRCWSWASAGEMWRGSFYCSECTEDYEAWRRSLGEKSPSALTSPAATPAPTPPPSPRVPVVGLLQAATAVVGSTTPKSTPRGGAKPPATPPWRPVVDQVDFEDYEVRVARARCAPAAQERIAVVDASTTAATPVARVVERCTGLSTSDPGMSLASLESLKVISLVSALRRELGVDLAAVDVARCSCLNDLEELCAEAKSAENAAPAAAAVTNGHAAPEPSWAIFAIPRFWKAPVGWLIRLDEVPDEACMRLACRALVHRHAGLRALPYRTSGDDSIAQLCNGAAPIVLVLRDLLGPAGCKLCTWIAEGLLTAWPRVSCLQSEGMRSGDAAMKGGVTIELEAVAEAHFEWQRFDTEADLRHCAWLKARSRGFRTPASISVLVLAKSQDADTSDGASERASRQEDTAYLHVAVNHAVTDASSIVPMVVDLLELHRAACSGAASPAGDTSMTPPEAQVASLLEAARLPPAPNGLEVQHERLRSALLTGSSEALRNAALDMAHNSFNPRRRGYDHYIRLLPGACRVLEIASSVIGVPTDHLLVTAIAAAFSKMSGRPEVKLSLIVPMRDGRGEGQVVANLATTRHLSLWVTGRSLLAIAMDLSTRLRRREWRTADVLADDGDRVFINVRGIPRFEGAQPVMEAVDTARKPTRFVRNLVEMFADQEASEQWTMWMGIRDDLEGSALAKAMRQAIWGLAAEPLQTFFEGEG